MLLLALLLLVPGLALGDESAEPWMARPSPVVASYPFNASGCYASGAALGSKGEPVTVTRASTATYVDGAGALQTCSANQLRVTPSGALVEGAATNYALNSESMYVDWPISGLTVAQGAAFGALFWANFTVTATSYAYVYSLLTVASTTTLAGSMSAKKLGAAAKAGVTVRCNTGTATACTCWRSDAGACTATMGAGAGFGSAGDCSATVTNLTATEIRLGARVTCSTANTGAYLLGGSYSSAGVSVVGEQVSLAGAQLETGSVATSYIATTGTSASRAADMVSGTFPANVGPIYCIDATVTPSAGAAWGVSTRLLFSVGASNTANSLKTYTTTSGQLVLDVYDGAGASKSLVITLHGFTAGSTHRVAACNAAGDLSLYADGAALSGTTSGTGTGLWSASPALLYTGAQSTGTSLNGIVKLHKVCRSANAARCK